MPTSRTKRSTPKLSEIARHVRAPKGITSTGWPAVEAKCAELGIRFRPWQPDVGRLILAKRADGTYAATIGGTGLSIPRQVGKTFLVGAIVFALCLLRPNLTVIWTAHRMRTSEETFGKMQAFARRKRIRPHIAKIVLGSGEEAILFRNGSRVLFGARAAGFGLGFDEVDVLIFDEAQRLKDTTLDDMIPATNQSRQSTGALLLFMGTPPRPTDAGEVFTRMRRDALMDDDEDTGWVEFGADEDFEPTGAPAPLTKADWGQVEKANPSFPDDTPREAILRMRKKLGHESFKREGLGIWPPMVGEEIIAPSLWELLADDGPDSATPPAALGVDSPPQGSMHYVAACWEDGDAAHVELVMSGTDDTATVEWIVAAAGRRRPVVIDTESPAASMIPQLKRRGVRVISGTAGDMAKACGLFYGDAVNGRLSHGGQQPVTDALMAAKKRNIGTAGGWGWDRRDPDANIAPLVAVTLARFGATLTKRRGNRADSERRAVVLA